MLKISDNVEDVENKDEDEDEDDDAQDEDEDVDVPKIYNYLNMAALQFTPYDDADMMVMMMRTIVMYGDGDADMIFLFASERCGRLNHCIVAASHALSM